MGAWRRDDGVWLSACLCALAGCLKPGSLEHRDKFKALLRADGGTPSAAAVAGSGAAKAGNDGGARDAGSSASSAADCPHACELIASRCATAGCHAQKGAAVGLDLESPGLVARVSGATAQSSACSGKSVLDRQKPEQSLLYTKLIDPPACGARMPLGGALAAADIDCMKRFVAHPSCGAAASASPDDDAGSASAPAGPASTIVIEAEDTGSVTPPLGAQKDANASGGSYLSVPTASMAAKNDNPGTDGVASYIFQLPRNGSYVIWGRVRAATTSNDSYWARVDGGAWVKWNNIAPGADWHWDKVHDDDAMDKVMQYELTSGQHTLNFAYRESGTDLDQIVITSDTTLMPTGAAK